MNKIIVICDDHHINFIKNGKLIKSTNIELHLKNNKIDAIYGNNNILYIQVLDTFYLFRNSLYSKSIKTTCKINDIVIISENYIIIISKNITNIQIKFFEIENEKESKIIELNTSKKSSQLNYSSKNIVIMIDKTLYIIDTISAKKQKYQINHDSIIINLKKICISDDHSLFSFIDCNYLYVYRIFENHKCIKKYYLNMYPVEDLRFINNKYLIYTKHNNIMILGFNCYDTGQFLIREDLFKLNNMNEKMIYHDEHILAYNSHSFTIISYQKKFFKYHKKSIYFNSNITIKHICIIN